MKIPWHGSQGPWRVLPGTCLGGIHSACPDVRLFLNQVLLNNRYYIVRITLVNSSLWNNRLLATRSQLLVFDVYSYRSVAVSADASTGESTRSLARPKSSSLASDLINMMLPEIARGSRSKRGRKYRTGGEVLGENLHSYDTTETVVAGT